MRKNIVKNRFTLVELLVSLGVFTILLILFMQFFSGMRLVWTNAEKRSNLSTDVRIAMDMLSSLVSTVYYSSASEFTGHAGEFPFMIDQTSTRPGKMYFASKTTIDLPGTNPIRFIGLQVPNVTENFGLTATSPYKKDEDGFYKLYLTVLSNDSSAGNGDVYPRFSPEFLNSSGNEQSAVAALSDLQTNLNGKLSSASNARIELLRNVVDFQIRAYDHKGALFTSTAVNCMPGQVEFQITVLSDEDFEKWITLKGGTTSGAETTASEKFREEKQITYTRRIYLGDQWRREAGYDQY